MNTIKSRIKEILRPFSPKPKIHKMHQKFFRREIPYGLDYPIASFTFDDFPRSALHSAGKILTSVGACGTYYTSLGLMDQIIEGQGPCFTRQDLDLLLEDNHELACHTFAHVGAIQNGLGRFRDEIVKNRVELAKIFPGYSVENFAYPGGEVTFRTKNNMRDHSESSRSCYSGINRNMIDLNLLLCQHMRMFRPLEDIQRVVDQAAHEPAWLVFYVHDVSHSPSTGGCTPEYFKAVVDYVAKHCEIFTVREALRRIKND
ncbi:MAG: polysaccharide deacetylase family protein [Verrucomicrobiota bacterium]